MCTSSFERDVDDLVLLLASQREGKVAEVLLSSFRLHGRTQLAPGCMQISSQNLGQLVVKYVVNPLSWKDLEMSFLDCFLLAKPVRRGGGIATMIPWVPLSIASLLSIDSWVMWLHIPLTSENVFLGNVPQKGALKLGVLDVWSKPSLHFMKKLEVGGSLIII